MVCCILCPPLNSNYNVGVDFSIIPLSTQSTKIQTIAWDTEGTKRRILEAAMAEFARFGPDGTTVEHIAKSANVNKERIYNYFGDKQALFSAVLRCELAKVAQAMPVSSFAVEDIGEYAGRAYDYHRQHPELSRLMRWEGLTFDSEVPDEQLRREYYGYKVQAMAEGQRQGAVSIALEADHLIFLVLALAGWWSAVPQVARMLTGPESEQEHARRRASVVKAARRLAGA
jgi:AcrR family transcriptional regulator